MLNIKARRESAGLFCAWSLARAPRPSTAMGWPRLESGPAL